MKKKVGTTPKKKAAARSKKKATITSEQFGKAIHKKKKHTKTTPQKKKRYINVLVPPEVLKQLHRIAIDEDSNLQKLLAEEAIDMIFLSRGLPTIASKQPE